MVSQYIIYQITTNCLIVGFVANNYVILNSLGSGINTHFSDPLKIKVSEETLHIV